jgi:hypothetical protein
LATRWEVAVQTQTTGYAIVTARSLTPEKEKRFGSFVSVALGGAIIVGVSAALGGAAG